METRSATTERIKRNIPYLLLVVACAALLARSFYGFSWLDESFYVALVDRLYRGASPFLDEWHPAQVYAPLLLPFYALWIAVTGGTDGVILWFRVLYVLISFATALVTYRVLARDFGRLAGTCIALCYFFYVRANILGMSYYALCTTFFLLGIVCSWSTWRRIRDNLDGDEPGTARVLLPFGAGVFFALSIVCDPYVIIVFALACLVGLICALVMRRGAVFVPFAWAIAGALIVAAIYLWYVFLRSDPAAIMANLGNIFSSHDENLSALERIPNYLSYLPVSKTGFAGTCALTVFLIVWRAKKLPLSPAFKRNVLIIDFALFALTCAVALATSLHPNKAFIAFVEFVVPLYFLADDLHPGKHPELFAFWLPGILLSLVWQFSSNTQVCGIIIGFSIASYGALITLFDVFPAAQQEIHDSGDEDAFGRALLEQRCARICRGLAVAAAVALVVITIAIRLTSVYGDCSWQDMDATIETGPAAGLITSSQHKADYEGVEELVSAIDDEGGVWIEPMAPWAYLETDGGCSAPSAWNTFPDESDWDTYINQQGHAKPEWILVTNDDTGHPVNIVLGREHSFPALEMYTDYNAQLRSALESSKEYAAYKTTSYGTLYKMTERTSISQG
ncbi:MAG: ArnT family glycosyltransferase [Coriobacteriales bacterium]|jgi:hypothetical protein